MNGLKSVLVTGGAGYVGSVLVPRLLKAGYIVKVLDLYLFGEDVLEAVRGHPNLEEIRGDIRDQGLLRENLQGMDSVIHLACISNDPSFELNPHLGKSINFDAFEPLVRISKENGVRRFVYASTASVYGVSDQPNVTESHPLVPLTDYNKFKAMCEPTLLEAQCSNFDTVIVRPATVCGFSPRQRFDLTVNILTNHAVNNGIIKVFGGAQKRPNIHIEDVVDLYLLLLNESPERIAGKTFNAGYQNHTVLEIAEIVQKVVERSANIGKKLETVITPSDDSRSYHISSQKIREELGFCPKRTIEDAVEDLIKAFSSNEYHDPMNNSCYFNVRRMKEVSLA